MHRHCAVSSHHGFRLTLLSGAAAGHRSPYSLISHHHSFFRRVTTHCCVHLRPIHSTSQCLARALSGDIRSVTTYATAIDTQPTSLVPSNNAQNSKVTIVAVVPAEKQHSLGVSWHEVIMHVADRLAWEDPDFKVRVFTEAALMDRQTQAQYTAATRDSQILLLLNISKSDSLKVLLESMQTVPTAIALESHPQLEAATKLNQVNLTTPWQKAAAATLPWSSSAKSAKVLQSVREVYERKTSDDLLFMLLVLIDAYITEVSIAPLVQLQPPGSITMLSSHTGGIRSCMNAPQMSHKRVTNRATSIPGFVQSAHCSCCCYTSWILQVPLVKTMQAQDLSTIWKMCSKCGKQILACVRDPECKAALDCLTSCSSNDQVLKPYILHIFWPPCNAL